MCLFVETLLLALCKKFATGKALPHPLQLPFPFAIAEIMYRFAAAQITL